MKLAITLCGQPRNFHTFFDSFKKTGLEADFFLHIYTNKDHPTVQEVLDLYQPKAFIIEGVLEVNTKRPFIQNRHINKNAKTFCDPKITDERLDYLHKANISYCQGLLQAVLLKRKYELKNGFLYDWVIRSRYDVKFNNLIDFENSNPNLYYSDTHKHANPDCMHDLITISNSMNSDLMSTMFMSMEYLFKNGTLFVPECFIENTLKVFGIRLNPVILDSDIVR